MSLTIDEKIVAAIDHEAQRSARPNRSAVVERVLRAWMRSQLKRELDQRIEAYYASLTDREIAEDAEWATVGDDAVTRLWDEP